MAQPLLGTAESPEQQTIRRLESELQEARDDLQDARRALERMSNLNARAIARLRHILGPLFGALKEVFGEMETIAPDTHPITPGAAPEGSTAASQQAWAAWKSRLGATTGKVIDALLLHGELDAQQISVATGLDRRTVTNTAVYRLNQAKLINKIAGRFSLKKL